jgi:hypothetical protein
MSSKERFSTNAEMLADFRATSQQVFVEAYEREMGENMQPGLVDKPLTALYLNIARDPQELRLGITSVTSERMTIQPINEGIMKRLDAHPHFHKLPQDIKERYEKIGTYLSSVALSKSLDIISVLPMEGIDSTHSTYLSDDSVRTVGVFTEKPDKIAIVAAKYFAIEALRYVHSDAFDGQGESDDEAPTSLKHRFALDMEPDLPLNGYEDREFLIAYRRAVIYQHNKAQVFLTYQIDGEKKDEFFETINTFLSICVQAVKRVDTILACRNDYE